MRYAKRPRLQGREDGRDERDNKPDYAAEVRRIDKEWVNDESLGADVARECKIITLVEKAYQDGRRASTLEAAAWSRKLTDDINAIGDMSK